MAFHALICHIRNKRLNQAHIMGYNTAPYANLAEIVTVVYLYAVQTYAAVS